MLAKERDLPRQFADALILRGDRTNHRRPPAVPIGNNLQNSAQLFLITSRALAIGFVDHENVRNLHQPGLQALHVVAHAGHQHHNRAIRQPHDFNFALPHAHCLDQDNILASSVQQQRCVARGLRQATQISARGHGPDENPFVARMALHADAIAQNRATGKRA